MNQLTNIKILTLADDYAGGGHCLAQHGISFFIEFTYEKGATKYLLFDTGNYHDPILFNAERLEVPLDKIEDIVLSHSHYDHTGGLIGLLRSIESKERNIIAHPQVFKQSYYNGDLLTNIGMKNENAKEVVKELKGKWVLTDQPFMVNHSVTFLGEIPRITKFEDELTIKLKTKINNLWVQDKIEDDSGIYISTPQGLIIIAGCSHSGIVNIVKQAIKVSGNNKIYAVIGGFHLLSANEDRILATAKALKELKVERLITGHCTGGVAEYLFQQSFKGQFQKLYAGKKMLFEF